MGIEEKVNVNSMWYLKRHPVTFSPVSFTIVEKKAGFWNRLVSFIKKIGELVHKRVTSPKEN